MAAAGSFSRAFAAMLPGEVAAEGVFSAGEITYKFIRDRNEHKEIYADNKEAFLESLKSMYYGEMMIWQLRGTKDGPNSYFGFDFTHFDPKDVTMDIVGTTEWGIHFYEISLFSDGAGNLLNHIAYQELRDRESTQGCNEGEKHAYFPVRTYYNPFIEDFLDYERFKDDDEPMIIGCCPEKFNGLQCVPYGTEFTKRTPQQLADFDCKVLKGINYVGVLVDPNHPSIDTNFQFSCKLNDVAQAKVDFLACMKQGGSYESCQLGGTTATTTDNGVSDAIDYMMTIDEGGEDDEEEEEEIETPPPDTTVPPPTDTGMSDADRERLNNYRRRRF